MPQATTSHQKPRQIKLHLQAAVSLSKLSHLLYAPPPGACMCGRRRAPDAEIQDGGRGKKGMKFLAWGQWMRTICREKSGENGRQDDQSKIAGGILCLL